MRAREGDVPGLSETTTYKEHSHHGVGLPVSHRPLEPDTRLNGIFLDATALVVHEADLAVVRMAVRAVYRAPMEVNLMVLVGGSGIGYA